MPNTTLHIRTRALDWLLAAAGSWLFQDRVLPMEIPFENQADWKAVGDLAHFHNLEPLLYWMLSSNRLPAPIPGWLKQRWERAYFGNFLRNEAYFHTLKRLLDRCRKEGIPVIVLKGPALIGRIYKDPALRTLSDLDIFCSRRDLPRMVKIGRDMGYTLDFSGKNPPFIYHVTMNQAASGAILEFHFTPYEVIRDHARFMQTAWNRKEWIEVDGFDCPVLCLEMEILFNVAHLVQHQFDASLKHYLDIAGLLVFFSGRLDQDEMEVMIRDFGLEQVFSLLTHFLSSMLRLPPVHQALRAEPKDRRQRKFDASLRDLLALLEEPKLFNARGWVWNFRIAMGNREGFGNRVAYFLVKTLFPFLGSLAVYRGIRSSGDAFRYYLRHLLFYHKRLLLTLAHLPCNRRSHKQRSPAVERAGAKENITRQLLSTQKKR